jgi:hypothetical protein
MTQRTLHSRIATVRAHAPADALRAAPIRSVAAAVAIAVLVIITGPTGAEYGFA